MATTTMNHPVVWFEVLGDDGAKLQKYYADLFGWAIKVEGPLEYGSVDTGGKAGIGGGVARSYPGTRPGVTFYVRADDLDGTAARAEKLGGKIVMAPRQIPGGPAIAMVQDPEGHVIGLVKDTEAA